MRVRLTHNPNDPFHSHPGHHGQLTILHEMQRESVNGAPWVKSRCTLGQALRVIHHDVECQFGYLGSRIFGMHRDESTLTPHAFGSNATDMTNNFVQEICSRNFFHDAARRIIAPLALLEPSEQHENC
jgi:hypothetical protein